MLLVAQSWSSISFMSCVATRNNGQTAIQMCKMFMKEFQKSVIHVYDCQVLSEINNRTYLSATANSKSIAFLAYDVYTGIHSM